MATDATPYAPRIRYVELLERSVSNVTRLEIYRDGSQIIPTAAQYTLIRPDGVGIVQDATATIIGDGTLQYTHPANHFPDTISLGEGYVQTWTVTIDGEVYNFRRTAAIVLRRLYPTVSDTDLETEYSDLGNLRPASLSSYQTYIDAAWYEILRRVRRTGIGYEYLILTPESFHDALLHLTLYKVFRDFHSSLGQSGNARFLDLAQAHLQHYNAEYDSINFVYDQNHQGRSNEPNKRTHGQPVIYLTAPGPNRWLRRK
jgi:hypothetical protein